MAVTCIDSLDYNISAISWQSLVLVEKTEVPNDDQRVSVG